MNEIKDKLTGEIINVKRLDNETDYICPDCGVDVKVKPNSLVDGPHEENCGYLLIEELKRTAYKQAFINDTLQKYYPATFSLKPTDELHSTSSYLHTIVRFFIDFPNDRDLALNLPTIGLTNYEKGFQKLNYAKSNSYSNVGIAFSQLYLKQSIDWESDMVTLLLLDGLWDNQKKAYSHQTRLNVNTSTWTTVQKEQFKEEITSFIENVVINRSHKSEKRGYVFFCPSSTEFIDGASEFTVTDINAIDTQLCEIVL